MSKRWSWLVGLAQPVGLWIVLVILASAGLTTGADRAVHDTVQRLRGERATGHRVIAVVIDDESLAALGRLPWSWDTLQALLEPILAGEPLAVGLTVPYDLLMPAESVPPPPIAGALAAGELVLPGRLVSGPGVSLPGVAYGAYGARRDQVSRDARFGLLTIEPDGDGVVRRQPLWVDTAAGRRQTMEAVLLEGVADPGDERTLTLAYVGPPGAVAHVSAIKVVRGEIEPEVFRDRAVLLGMDAPGLTPLLVTPVNRRGELMPAVEVHASALATALDGRRVRAPRWPVLWALLPALVLLFPVIRRGELVADVLLVAGLTAVVTAGSVIAALAADLRLPLATVVLALWCPLAAEAVARVSRSRRRLQDLVTDISRGVSTRATGLGDGDPARFWSHLASFLGQFTSTERVVVGERMGTRQRFRWVGAVGMGLDEVALDAAALRRAGVRRALRAGRPAVLPGGDWTAHEDVLAVPLSAAGEVLGLALLVVGDGPSVLRATGTRITAAAAVGGRMIAQQRSARGAAASGMLRVLTRVGLEHQLDMARAMSRTMLEEQTQWKGVIQGLPMGILFADMLGDVQFANEAARRLLARAGHRWTPAMRMAELLAALSGRPVEDVSAALFLAYRGETPTVFRWEVAGVVRRSYRATVTPVLEPESTEERAAAMDLGQRRTERSTPLGYLCTVEDVTAARETMRARTAILDALGTRARTHLMVLQGVAELLAGRDDLDEDVRQDLQRIISQGSSLTRLIEEFTASAVASEDAGSGIVPVDLGLVARQVVESVGEALGDAHRLVVKAPVLCTPVLLDRDGVAHALYRIVADSLVNSPASSTTRVVVAEGETSIVAEVRDEGYGIPRAVLEQLHTPEADESDVPEVLALARRAIAGNGGTLEIESRVGRGTTYRITFAKGAAEHRGGRVRGAGR